MSSPLEPIWARPEPSGRRASRSREDIAAAAVAVADAEGVEAVSMRRVARELGLGTMSLYHYVRSKDELLDLMSDAILAGQIVPDEVLRRGWREALTAIAHATRANFERHPWILGAMRPRPRSIPGPSSLRHIEQSIAAVASTGADLRLQMEIIALVDDYVFGFAVRAIMGGLEPRAQEAEPGWVKGIFDYMRREIDTGAYPNLQRVVEANRAAGRTDEELSTMIMEPERFDRGLERLLDGIEASLPKRRRGR